MSDEKKEKPVKKLELANFLIAFLMPMLIGKTLIMYFGSYYASYPGEGYGYGLAASIAFTIGMVARFLWTFRNYED
jgi:hypothetical protein